MGNWTPTEWGMFLTALGTLITAVLSATAAFLANLAKIKSEDNSKKIDANTDLTKEGTQEASTNAKIAASTARVAAVKASEMSDKLNGSLDAKITNIVKEYFTPLESAIKLHAEQDEKNMKEIREALGELRDRTVTKGE